MKATVKVECFCCGEYVNPKNTVTTITHTVYCKQCAKALHLFIPKPYKPVSIEDAFKEIEKLQ